MLECNSINHNSIKSKVGSRFSSYRTFKVEKNSVYEFSSRVWYSLLFRQRRVGSISGAGRFPFSKGGLRLGRWLADFQRRYIQVCKLMLPYATIFKLQKYTVYYRYIVDQPSTLMQLLWAKYEVTPNIIFPLYRIQQRRSEIWEHFLKRYIHACKCCPTKNIHS